MDESRYADDLPDWFKGPRPAPEGGRLVRACGKCGAPAGEPCRRITYDGRHKIGDPCQPHQGR